MLAQPGTTDTTSYQKKLHAQQRPSKPNSQKCVCGRATMLPTPLAQHLDAYGGRNDAGTPQAKPPALLRTDGDCGAGDRSRHRRHTDTREINELPRDTRGTHRSEDVELIEIWLAMSPFVSVVVGKFLRGAKGGVA
ncbi:hypothetical protein A0U90_06420 [Kozakia baliensis]|nr:hypothetical protein A0U90_06420 [Kozakia baliensis]